MVAAYAGTSMSISPTVSDGTAVEMRAPCAFALASTAECQQDRVKPVGQRIAGGEDVFSDLAVQKAAKDRIVSPEAVIAAAPDAILASWCGKKVVPDLRANSPLLEAAAGHRRVNCAAPCAPARLRTASAAFSRDTGHSIGPGIGPGDDFTVR
jgi:hypothetical protein